MNCRLLLLVIALCRFICVSASGDNLSITDAYYTTAIRFLNNGKPDSAKTYFIKASDYYAGTKSNINRRLECLYYLSRLALNHFNDYKALNKYADQIDEIAGKNKYNNQFWFESRYFVGVGFIRENKFDKAYQLFNKLEGQTVKYNIPDSSIAKFYSKKGMVSYYKGDYFSALNDYNYASEYGSKAFGENSIFVSDQVNNLGVINFMINRFDDALNCYIKAEKLLKSSKTIDDIAIADNYINIGLVFKEKSDYHEALEFLERAKALYLKHESDNRGSITHLYLNIAGIYEDLRQFPEQFQNIIKAKEYGEKYFRRLLPKIYFQLAFYYESGKDLATAYKYLNKAINEAKILFGKSADLAHAYNNLGEFCLNNNYRIKETLPNFQKALDFFTNTLGSRNQGVVRSNFNIGSYYDITGNADYALKYYQKALQICVDEKLSNDVYISPIQLGSVSDNYYFEILKAKAGLFLRLSENTTDKKLKIKNLNASLNHYQQIIKLIDKFRAGFVGEESGFILSDNIKEIFSNSIYVSYQLYELTNNSYYSENAFIIADKLHSANLQQMIKKKGSKDIFQWNDTSFRKRNILQKELNTLHDFITIEKTSRNCDSSKIILWNNKIANLVVQINKLETEIRENHPAYEHLMYRGSDTTLIPGLRRILTPGEALLEYYYTDKTIYSFCVLKDQLFIHKQDLKPDFFVQIKNISDFLQTPRVSPKDSVYTLTYREAAFHLYQMLVSPFEEKIKQKALIIVPFSELNNISFGILLTRSTKNKNLNFKELPYLIKKNPVRYLYAADLVDIRNQKTNNGKILAFAPVYNTEPQNKQKVFANSRDKLNPLTYNTREVESILQSRSDKVFESTKASESNFKKFAKNYGIIHLAMHAVIDNETPGNSRLVFTPNSSATYNDDLLYSGETYNLELNTDLLVLSACRSGSGKLQSGEGMISLTRGFIFAGVKSIVTSLWTVNDKSSSEFFKLFYKNLAQKENKSLALQNANLQYLSTTDNIHAHPYYWAGFILIGQNNPVYFNNIIPIPVIIGISIIILTLIVFFVRKKWK